MLFNFYILTLSLCFLFACATARFYYLLKKSQESKAKLLSAKKSTEVRTGHIVEKFAPFLDSFPHSPEKAVFLGQPIDYLVFEDHGITFAEIKSGNAQLSKKQRSIRDHVKQGNVFWEEIRIDEK